MASQPEVYTSVDTCVDRVIDIVGRQIVLGVPLGLGKPNQLVNAFYRKAKANPDIQLKILTALTLEKPKADSDIEARFLEPFVQRQFGDYVELDYMVDIRHNRVPGNITVSEFYFKAGAMKSVPYAQQHYISTNYTYIAREMIENGINVLVQLVARKALEGEIKLSLSCNTDVTLDLLPMLEKERANGKRIVIAGQVHDELPFMYNAAIVDTRQFDMLVHHRDYNTTLFASPNMSVSPQDFASGFHASSLIKDGGTLQIGIGSLGDAIVYACQLRHRHNETYRTILKHLGMEKEVVDRWGGLEPFEKGIYGASEMFVNGFMHLIQAGIVKRKVYDDLTLQRLINEGKITETVTLQTLDALQAAGAIDSPLTEADVQYLRHWGLLKSNVKWHNGQLVCESRSLTPDLADEQVRMQLKQDFLGSHLANGIHMHGGFFLGPKDFYEALRKMPQEAAQRICMSSVGHINQLKHNPSLLIAQRQHARFINTGMMVTLSGAVVSDGLEDGTVISGVGGQYNFVAMAHDLPGAKSILCVRATRGSGKDMKSNIVPHYGHTTIPRHLRDVIITEYGIADLRGKTDEAVIMALLNVADSRFQEALMNDAKDHHKLRSDYEIPAAYRNNTPDKIQGEIEHWRKEGYCPPFPLGTDFTEEEIAIGKSLKEIKALQAHPPRLVKAIIKAFLNEVDEEEAQRYLERMSLEHPHTAKETIIQHLLLMELEEKGYLKPL